MTRKSTKTKKTNKTTVKKNTKKIENKLINENLSYAKEDKILKKIEKYVDDNREKTAKEISERKSKRP